MAEDYWKRLQTGLGRNANAMIGLGSGLLSANNFASGLAAGGQGFIQGAEQDDAWATQQKAEADRLKSINATAEYLRRSGDQRLVELAGMVDSGALSGADAFKAAWEYQNQDAPEPFTLGAGEVRYDASGNIIAQGLDPASAVKPTSSMQEYQFAQSQGYAGTFQEYETAMKQAGATNIDFNQNQGVAAGFADRMAAANAVLDDPGITGAQTDPVQGAVSGVPVVGNYLTSQERQMAEQAQRDFVNAILRRESGAAIAPSEFDNATRQYFPQPGDTPAVIEQKRRNREIAIQGVARAAGPAYAAPPVATGGGIVDYTTYFGGQ